jgi:hypothetical protein
MKLAIEIKNRLKEFEKQNIPKREYYAIHKWISRRLKNKSCAHCDRQQVRIENALIKGKLYERNVNNFIPLCNSCHSKYDETNKGIKRSDLTKIKMSIAKTGRKLSIETKLKMSKSHIGLNTWSTGRIGEKSNHKKPVIDTITKNVYPTVKDAALNNSINKSRLSAMLIGKLKNTTTLSFYEK